MSKRFFRIVNHRGIRIPIRAPFHVNISTTKYSAEILSLIAERTVINSTYIQIWSFLTEALNGKSWFHKQLEDSFKHQSFGTPVYSIPKADQ
jgi:hypothetical protein